MTVFGIIITLVYIGIILILRWCSLPLLETMPLNEFGDFFAGVFGPLMLFWLMLGYIQQQKELKQNTAALELQAEELKKSVEQHKELVKAAKEQLKADLKALELEQFCSLREAHPVFEITNAGWSRKSGDKYTYKIIVQNVGPTASAVFFSTAPGIKQISQAQAVHYFETGKTHTLEWDTETSGPAPSKLTLIINCRDANTRHFTKTFDLLLDEDNKYHLDSVGEVG